MNTIKTIVAAAAAALLLAPGLAAATAYDGIVAFGDSLSDNGNLFALTGGLPAAPYWNGRFSNGPVAVEDMAADMHLGLQDYAFGGAQTGMGNVEGSALYGTGVAGQLGMFATAHPAGADSHSLYLVWAGPNDFLQGTNLFNPNTAPTAVGNLVQDMSTLYGMGARDFLVPLMPNLGITPEVRADGAAVVAVATQQSALFDTELSGAMATFSSAHAGVQMTVFDTPAFFTQTSAALAAQGVNITQSCYNAAAGTLCANPSDYLFWDGVHPTAGAHALLGQAFATAVPEPGSLALMLGGLVLVGGVARRRPRDEA